MARDRVIGCLASYLVVKDVMEGCQGDVDLAIRLHAHPVFRFTFTSSVERLAC